MNYAFNCSGAHPSIQVFFYHSCFSPVETEREIERGRKWEREERQGEGVGKTVRKGREKERDRKRKGKGEKTERRGKEKGRERRVRGVKGRETEGKGEREEE